MPNKPTTLREWEKEFDEKFVVKSNAGTGLLRYTDADKIKSFLNSAIDKCLTSHNTELLQKIEGLRKVFDPETAEGMYHDFVAVDGYNQALDEVISLINQNK